MQIFHPPKLDFLSLTVFLVFLMANRRERGGGLGSPEGGPAKVGCKGNFFIRVEEEQLCKSVMLVSQDRVVGNQQKAGVFWERITKHYNENRPDGVRCRVEKSLRRENTGFLAAISFGLRHERLGYYRKYPS